jgi:hypothetical protein
MREGGLGSQEYKGRREYKEYRECDGYREYAGENEIETHDGSAPGGTSIHNDQTSGN